MAAELDVPILHVDMDAFFVEVERLRDPELVGRPVMVGGTGPRAVVASASYEARAYGVTSAMPMAEARRRCRAGVVVPPDHEAYRAMSRRVFSIFGEFSPHVEPLSVDEAFLDISGLRLHYPDAAGVAADLRHELRARLALPASVGGATTKFLAKLASEEAKPDGIYIVSPGAELDFLHPMPVRRLWGVGEATLAGIESLGVRTVGELAAVSVETLQARLGSALGSHLASLAAGVDDRRVADRAAAKSISVEETFDTDLWSDDEIDDALFTLCHRLAGRLERAGSHARTITLKVRLADFSTVTRSETPPRPTGATSGIWDVARDLLRRVDRGGLGVRLLGVGGTGLIEASESGQLRLDEPDRSGADLAARRVRRRFGGNAIKPARLVRPPQQPDNRAEGTTQRP